MSTTEEEFEEDEESRSSSEEALFSKRNRKIPKKHNPLLMDMEQHQEVKTKIETSVKSFLKLRFKHTNIHPTKDPVITYICRVFKHFLLKKCKTNSKPYRLYYNLFIDELINKYEVNNACINRIRTIFNAIPSHKFTYLIKSNKDKIARGNSRCWSLNQKHYDFQWSLKQIQTIRQLFKYTAIDWDNYNSKRNDNDTDNIQWRWIGDGIDDTKDNITNYMQVRSSKGEIFGINDIVIVKHSEGLKIRPWIGRIIQLFNDNNDKGKKATLRWFWFWNQIIDEIAGIDEIEQNGEDMLGGIGKWPARACDVFETVKDSAQFISDEPIGCIVRMVYVIHEKSIYSKRVLDGVNVFECNFNFDPEQKKFYKKSFGEIADDEQRLVKKMGNINGNGNTNTNTNVIDMNIDDVNEEKGKENDMGLSNVKDDMEVENNDVGSEEDNDLDVSDIKGNNHVGFTIAKKKSEQGGCDKEEEDKESGLSESEIQSDNSLSAHVL